MILALGVSTTDALVLSQVVLSFGIPFALIPLVVLTSRRDVMGDVVNGRLLELAAVLRGGGDHRHERVPDRPAAARLSTLRSCDMSLAQQFTEIVASLPDDWTDLELDLRIFDERRYVDAAVVLVTCNAQPYSKHDWHWRLLVAHRFGHAASVPAVHLALKLLDDAGHRRRAGRCARCAPDAPRSCRCGAAPSRCARSSKLRAQ